MNSLTISMFMVKGRDEIGGGRGGGGEACSEMMEMSLTERTTQERASVKSSLSRWRLVGVEIVGS